jgi:hypothetical protein
MARRPQRQTGFNGCRLYDLGYRGELKACVFSPGNRNDSPQAAI